MAKNNTLLRREASPACPQVRVAALIHSAARCFPGVIPLRGMPPHPWKVLSGRPGYPVSPRLREKFPDGISAGGPKGGHDHAGES